MHHVLGGTKVWLHNKLYANIKNGQYTFFLLKRFLLGLQYVTHMDAQFEIKLPRFSYDGKKRDFTFQKFVSLHKFQHNIFNGLMEYGYSGVDDNFKVRMLMNGKNTNALDTCKASILDNPKMQGEFEITERHFIDFITMNPSLQKNATAKSSFMTTSEGGRGGEGGIERGSGMPSESDVQATMRDIKKNNSVDLNGVMSPQRSTRRRPRIINKL